MTLLQEPSLLPVAIPPFEAEQSLHLWILLVPKKLVEVFTLHVWEIQASQTPTQSVLARLWVLVWVFQPEGPAVSLQELP